MIPYENCPGGIVWLPVCEEKLEHAPLPLGEPYDRERYVISSGILCATFDLWRCATFSGILCATSSRLCATSSRLCATISSIPCATFRSILCATSSRLCATISSILCATFRSWGRRSFTAWGDSWGRLWLGQGIRRFLSEQLQQSIDRRGIHRQVTSEAISS